LVSHDRDLIERSCNRFWVIREGRIHEAHSAERAYVELLGDAPERPAAGFRVNDARREELMPEHDDEAMLIRWYELDGLLAADLARKPRHQTPRLQQSWRDELSLIAERFGLH
ncbi:MAG: ABC transporter ATP-binding protein, partial [Aeromonas molluscorum]